MIFRRVESKFWRIAVALLACPLAVDPSVAFCSDVENAGLAVVQDQSTVKIIRGGQMLVEYCYTDVPKKPYVKQLVSLGGINVLRDAPHDHLHHHALMFAIGIDGVDFWSENEKCGRQQHRSIAAALAKANGSPNRVDFTHQLDWIEPASDRPLVSERRTIELAIPEGDNVSLLTWTTRLEPAAGRKSVTLGGSHYFGLGIRFVESMDQDGRHFNADGIEGQIVRGEERLVTSRWCAYSAKANGKPVTVALFDHPGNPRHPATMFTMPRPFAYLSATLNLWKEPMIVSAEKPLELCYGVALWDGDTSSDAIQGIYQQWVATTQGAQNN
jgi:hypothetical protein